MQVCKIVVCATALAVSAAYPQSSTTRRITRAGTASLRPHAPASGNPQLSESDPTSTEATLSASEGDKRGISTGAGAGIPATSATVAKSNPELRLSFDGIRLIDSRLADNTLVPEPPDQGLSAGNGFVMESVNNAIRVYDTNGNPLSAVTSQHTFYGYPVAFNRATGAAGPAIFDPVCYFDPDTQRWFHVVITFDRVGTTFNFAGPNRSTWR